MAHSIYWFDLAHVDTGRDVSRDDTSHVDTVVVFGRKSSTNKSIAWRVTGIPYQLHFQLSKQACGGDDVLMSERIICLHKEVNALIDSACLKQRIVAQLLWSRVEKRACSHVSRTEDDSEHATDELSWYECITIKSFTPNASIIDSIRKVLTKSTIGGARIFDSPSDLKQRFLLSKFIAGPCWLSYKGVDLLRIARSPDTTCDEEYDISYDHLHARTDDEITDDIKSRLHLKVLIMTASISNFNMYEQEVAREQHRSCVQMSACTFVYYDFYPFAPSMCGYVASADHPQRVPFGISYSSVNVPLAIARKVPAYDIIVGYGLFDVLLPALVHCNVDVGCFSRMRRCRVLGVPAQYRQRHYQSLLSGRLYCDAYKMLKFPGLFNKHITSELADMGSTSFRARQVESESIVRNNTCNDAKTLFGLMSDNQILYTLFYLSRKTGAPLRCVLELSSISTNNWWLVQAFYSKGYVFHSRFFERLRVSELENDKSFASKRHRAATEPEIDLLIAQSDASPRSKAIESDDAEFGAEFESIVEPDASNHASFEGRGGYVLAPTIGVHDNVFALDVSAMYVSIIISLNLCWTKLSIAQLSSAFTSKDVDMQRLCMTVDGSAHPDARHRSVQDLGVLPGALYEISLERTSLKRQAQSLEGIEREACLAKIKALKLQSNSVYGCIYMSDDAAATCGFKFSSAYIGETITSFGRSILAYGEEYAGREPSKHAVIYGDTDSLMIRMMPSSPRTMLDESAMTSYAQLIAQQINSALPGISFVVDGVYSRFYLMKKKCYAALVCKSKSSPYELVLKGCGEDQGGMARILLDTRKGVLLDVLCHYSDIGDNAILQHAISSRISIALHRLTCGRMHLSDLVIVSSLKKGTIITAYDSDQSVLQNKHIQAARVVNLFGTYVKPGQSIAHIMCETPVQREGGIFAYPPNLLWLNRECSVKQSDRCYTPLVHASVHWYTKHLLSGLAHVLPCSLFNKSFISECLSMKSCI